MQSQGQQNYGTEAGLEAGVGAAALTGNSMLLTASLIIADVVGAGVLALSVAIARVGWLGGTVLIVVLMIMNVHISILMWRVRMQFPEIHSYVGMASMAFSKAADSHRKAMVCIANVGQHMLLFAFMGVYVLCCGRALGSIFYSIHTCLPTWALIACLIILPFHAMARKLGTFQSLIWVNVATILGTIFIPLGYMLHQGVDSSRASSSHFFAFTNPDFRDTFIAISTLSISYTSQFMVIEIISEMKDPSEFPTSYIRFAAPFQLIAYLVVGLGGYYFVGDQVTGMIGDNIPFGFCFRLAAACLLAHMLVTYMVKGIVLCKGVHTMIDPDATHDYSGGAAKVWGGLVVFVAGASWLIANLVPFFNELVDLIGATLVPVICYIVPICCYMRMVKDFPSKAHPPRSLEDLLIMSYLVMSVFLLIFGTYYSVLNIVEHWHTFGPPFGCHCHDVWNTCQCSAMHSGMQAQCPAGANATHSFAVQENMVDANFDWLGMYSASNIRS